MFLNGPSPASSLLYSCLINKLTVNMFNGIASNTSANWATTEMVLLWLFGILFCVLLNPQIQIYLIYIVNSVNIVEKRLSSVIRKFDWKIWIWIRVAKSHFLVEQNYAELNWNEYLELQMRMTRQDGKTTVWPDVTMKNCPNSSWCSFD